MADWVNRLDVSKSFNDCKEGDITPAELASLVAHELEKMKINDADLEDEQVTLIDMFKMLAGDETATIDDFDEIWEQLYDWEERSCQKKQSKTS